MIRLIFALLATIFVTFVIAGTDRGQVRYGLMTTGATPVAAQGLSPQNLQNLSGEDASETIAESIYVPEQAVISHSQPSEPANLVPAESTNDLALSADIDQVVRFVAVKSANVRDGPSKDFAVIEKLSRGEAVTVVAASDDPEGWTLIRIEGDGLEGYVSNALLSDQP